MKKLLAFILLIAILIGCAPANQPTLQPTHQPDPIQEAETAPETESTQWWQDAVFYEIFVRSFYDTDGDGIGDFNGITQKLDYLQQLGINAIWLMPIHPSPSYHGYDVTNYYNVNPEYGTMDDFKNLINEAHKRDIRIIIDLVLNHTSSKHPFFIDANNNPQSSYRDWYIWSDTPKGNYWHEGKNGYYFGFFWGGMPDLNYRNPAVTSQMLEVTGYWLEDIGIDGFRVDAAKHLIEEDNKVENTKSTHEWYKEFYTFYKSGNSDVYTVGEVFGAGAFMGKTYENEFDHIFNFELASGIMLSALVGTNTPIDSAIQFTLNDKPDYSFATFLTNHDQDRAMSVLDGDMAKAKVAAFLLLTSPGTPFLYYGEEIGMQGRKPDENIRLPMQWNSSKDAGFTTGKPWRPLNTNYRDVNVEIQTDDTNSLLNHYRELIEVRNTHPALHTGTYYEVKSNDSSVFAALRVDGNETLLVVINLSDESITDYTLTLEDMVLTDGTYGAETLFGDAQVKGPSVTRGIFQNYRPINELNPFSTLIVKLQP